MTNWDRVRRRFGEIAFDHLRDRSAAIIGCGSGGGNVALDLAQAGIGNFMLIDPSLIKEENIVRHVADSRYIGRPKVEAVAELIRYRNETAVIETLREDITKCFAEVAAKSDILLVCVDEEPIKHLINIEARKAGKTAIYAGVYEKGEGGDICIVYPDTGPCYACIASKLRISDGPKENLEYGVFDEKGTLHGEPGLGIHVKRIASFQSDWAIRELLKGKGSTLTEFPAQVLVFNNEAREIFEDSPKCKPCTGLWVHIQKDPKCLVCSLTEAQAPTMEELLS